MLKSFWDIFFDLHGVIADVNAVNNNYRSYLARILTPTGISQEKVTEIHDIAFKKWIGEITKLFEDFDQGKIGNSESNAFMEKYKMIDEEWEEFVLEFVPKEHKTAIKPLLNTSIVEYNALADGSYPILYPEVVTVLTELKKHNNLRLHIASSASSRHIRGVVKHHNLDGFFRTLIGYDTTRAPKKTISGIYFRNMLQITCADPAKSIFIGDSFEEANIAIKFGMEFIFVKRDKNFIQEKFEDLTITIIDNLTELLPIIKKLVHSDST